MRLLIFSIVFLFMLANASFAQSVWDNYHSTKTYDSNKEESVQNESLVSDSLIEEDNFDRPVNRKIMYVQQQKQWYIGDAKATPEAVETLLKTNPDAAIEVNKAKTYFVWGLVCAGIGGSLFGYGIAEWSKETKKFTKPVTFAGLGVISVGLTLANLSWGRTRTAVEIYNKSLGYNPSMYLSLAPTPQGGLALALVF